MVSYDARVVVLGLRIAQGVLAIIVLGLTAYVANWWNHFYAYIGNTSPSEINFLLFSSVWTLLALAYLIIVPWRFSETKAHHKFAILAVEAITMIFWFAGFIALAVFFQDRPCKGRVCSSAKAAAAFGGFEWALFAATTTMAVMHVFRTRTRGPGDNNKADPNFNVQESVG